jgi:hypothetical protein
MTLAIRIAIELCSLILFFATAVTAAKGDIGLAAMLGMLATLVGIGAIVGGKS